MVYEPEVAELGLQVARHDERIGTLERRQDCTESKADRNTNLLIMTLLGIVVQIIMTAVMKR